MRAYRPRIFDDFSGGWNRIEKPTPKNCYDDCKNIRLTEMSIPEGRPGTDKKNTGGSCALAATAKPIVNAFKYYPADYTAQWVAVADDGSNLRVYMCTDGVTFGAAESTAIFTSDTDVYFAVFPMIGKSGNLRDNILMVNGTTSEMFEYDPESDGWQAMSGTPIDAPVHVWVHGNRAWLAKNDYVYYSTLSNTSPHAWNRTTQYLDVAYQGETVICGVSFNGDNIFIRPNSIGVMRGKDPLSGVQINALVTGSGSRSPKTLIEATYRGQKALYYLSLQGLAVFNGYQSKLIDGPIDIIGLMNTTSIGDACAGLYENRYLMLSFRSSSGTVNDTTVVYDTLKDIFVSKDTGYYPNCYWLLNGGTDKGELYFGTSNDLGLIYQFGSGTVDESPVTDGTDVNIDEAVQIGGQASGSLTQQTKIRKINVAMDTGPESRYIVKLLTEDERHSYQKVFSDTRSATVHTWGETGFKWGADGVVWGTGSEEQRSVFEWNIPQSIHAPHEYKVRVESDNQDKEFRLHQIEVPERPRMPK